MAKLNNLHDLYVQQLKDLHSAETQLIDALPMMAEQANHAELRRAFEEHLRQTEQHRERLDQIGKNLGMKLSGETCQAMKGLIKEGNEMMKERAADAVKDAGLIATAQRVEHYEISGYGTVCTFAEMLGRRDDLSLLQQTLAEEKETDERLNRLAKQVVNPEALHANA